MDVLETDRLLIRPFSMSDLEAACPLLDDDYWSGPTFPAEQRRERLRFLVSLANWRDAGALYGDRAIVLREQQKLVGMCGVDPWLWTPDKKQAFSPLFEGTGEEMETSSIELELGYNLIESHRGRGYATEAVRALIRFVFEEARVKRIVATTVLSNTRSIRMMERLGMRTTTNQGPRWAGVAGILYNTVSCGGCS